MITLPRGLFLLLDFASSLYLLGGRYACVHVYEGDMEAEGGRWEETGIKTAHCSRSSPQRFSVSSSLASYTSFLGIF